MQTDNAPLRAPSRGQKKLEIWTFVFAMLKLAFVWHVCMCHIPYKTSQKAISTPTLGKIPSIHIYYYSYIHIIYAKTRRDLRLWKSWCSPWMSWSAPILASCLRNSKISLKNSTSPWQFSFHENRKSRHGQNMPWLITHLWRPRQSIARVCLHCFFTLPLVWFLFWFWCQTSHAAWTMAEGCCRWRKACKLKQITQGYGCQRAEYAKMPFSWDQCLQLQFALRTMCP